MTRRTISIPSKSTVMCFLIYVECDATNEESAINVEFWCLKSFLGIGVHNIADFEKRGSDLRRDT